MQTEMGRPQILWADDEIELLKPHILFLNEKGYDVTGVNSGVEALDEVEAKPFDVVFLDENMPGLNGIETLQRIKTRHPDVPVIMITKSEEEHIMEEAIGSKISDYLIKPVNPNQILLAVKKILDNRRLRGEQAQSTYMREFRELAMKLGGRLNAEESWKVLLRIPSSKLPNDSFQFFISLTTALILGSPWIGLRTFELTLLLIPRLRLLIYREMVLGVSAPFTRLSRSF